MRLLPHVGPHRGVVSIASQQPSEYVIEVNEDIEVVANRTAHKHHEIGSEIARLDAPDEEQDAITFSEKILLGLSSDTCKHSQGEGIPIKHSEASIGLDVHKETNAVAIADACRDGEVQYWGTMPNTMHHLGQLVTKLAKKHRPLEFTYEAGPCGYYIYRHLKDKGFACQGIASSQIHRRAGGKVKNDDRESVTLARLARAGELTAIWVPHPVHEVMRDLVRARHAASKDLKQARQRI